MNNYKLYLGMAGGAAVAVVGAPFVLTAAGFGSAGVIGGSMAAAYQASIGNVMAGSLFATLQSAGAAGLAASTLSALGAAGAGVGAAVTAVAGAVIKKLRGTGVGPEQPIPNINELDSESDGTDDNEENMMRSKSH